MPCARRTVAYRYRSLCLTHLSHTTLITGVRPRLHGVVGNRVTVRRTGERLLFTNLTRRESVKAATIFDVVKASGRRTAAFFRPETRSDAAIDDNVAEVFRVEGGPDPREVTPGLPDELRSADVPIDAYYAFYDNPYAQGAGDLALTQAAAHVFERRKPAFTAIHLLVTDKAQHEFGPSHYLSWGALTADIETHLTLDPKNSSTARRLMDEPYHGHGFLPDYPEMYPVLVLSGSGIARGARLGHVRNIDEPPTIAALLGLEMRGVEGLVLREAIRQRAFSAAPPRRSAHRGCGRCV
ncbi:MAG TPA: hypothetical protein DCX80_01470 [Chloroflexi bacterium]|nr:hypothetical protein [Chloroflexota bacterium]